MHRDLYPLLPYQHARFIGLVVKAVSLTQRPKVMESHYFWDSKIEEATIYWMCGSESILNFVGPLENDK